MQPSPLPARVRDGRGSDSALLIVAIVLVALAVRAIAWHRTGVMFNDGPTFIGLARLIELGHWDAVFAHPFHPLYPAAIALVHMLCDDWETAAVVVSALSGAVASAVLFALLRLSFDLRIAYIGALLLAFHPHAVSNSADVQSDGLYLLLFLTAVTALWLACVRRRSGWAFAAGASAGLAYWVRPEGLGVALIGVVIGAIQIALRRWPPLAGLRWISAMALAAALVAAPYVLVLHHQTGSWMITQKKSVLLSRAMLPPSPLPASVMERDPFLETVVRGPRVAAAPPTPEGARLKGAAGGAGLELLKKTTETLGPTFVCLLLIGAVFGIRSDADRDLFFALLVGAYLAVLYLLVFQSGYVSKRHALPVAVLSFGYVAAGTTVVGGWFASGLERLGWFPVRHRNRWAAMLGASFAIAVGLPSTFHAHRADRVAERAAAIWLRGQPDAHGGPVAAGKQRVAYYAGAPHVRLPDPGTPDALASLEAAGAEYLIIDDHYLDENPALRRASKAGMSLLHRTHEGGNSAEVYRIRPPGADAPGEAG